MSMVAVRHERRHCCVCGIIVEVKSLKAEKGIFFASSLCRVEAGARLLLS